jgi:hypothetical protein
MNYIKITQAMDPTSIEMGGANKFYITTQSVLPQSPPVTNPLPCLGISEFLFTVAANVWTPTYA